jgi:serine-type D-Ala-D-Ala carboxypeptidase (penicillin-binding protein 5/6)
MRLGARPAAVLAALAAVTCLTTVSPIVASADAATNQHAGTGQHAASQHTSASAKPKPSQHTSASAKPKPSQHVSTGAPSGTSQQPSADATIGGPLMASKGIVVYYPNRKAPKVPSIPASAWVIANANTGQVLAAKDAHGLFGPASTLKVLTAITLIPKLNPNAWVLATKLAASAEPNDAGLIAGRKYQVKALFTALLTISANDAAVALTQATGSFATGMAMINAEARHLQAYDVVAKEPNGLPAAGQVVSAYDEALIARQAVSMPAFMKYDSTLSARFEVKPRHWETLLNQNYLLTQYPGGIGGKIGWTMSSQATYIGLARRNGVTLIVTLLHCTPLQEIISGEKLLNWGFAMNGKVRPVGELVPPLPTTTAVHKSSHPRPRPVAGAANSGVQPAPYAVAAGVAVVGIGLGGYVGRRRRRRLRYRR